MSIHTPCCTGDFNPWIAPPVCPTCGDARHVFLTPRAGGESARRAAELFPCPDCADELKRTNLFDEWRKKNRPAPGLRDVDLSDEEAKLLREWRSLGFHELEALRWLEGRRYDPGKDQAFQAELAKARKKWAFRTGRS
jgi:hypothetical protein